MNIDICLLPSSCNPWPQTGFSTAYGSCKAFPAHSHTYTFNLREKRAKKKKPSFSPGKRKKVFTHSHTIFPFTHKPVQVVCSPQSIIFTVVTNGRKAYCNYSYRYWGHLEVVSPHWKTELLELSKYSQKAVVNTQGGCKEATKWHICIVEKKRESERKQMGKISQ